MVQATTDQLAKNQQDALSQMAALATPRAAKAARVEVGAGSSRPAYQNVQHVVAAPPMFRVTASDDDEEDEDDEPDRANLLAVLNAGRMVARPKAKGKAIALPAHATPAKLQTSLSKKLSKKTTTEILTFLEVDNFDVDQHWAVGLTVQTFVGILDDKEYGKKQEWQTSYANLYGRKSEKGWERNDIILRLVTLFLDGSR